MSRLIGKLRTEISTEMVPGCEKFGSSLCAQKSGTPFLSRSSCSRDGSGALGWVHLASASVVVLKSVGFSEKGSKVPQPIAPCHR